MWTRARRFANIYAYLALDILFALLWFSAFIAVAAWEARGVREGSKIAHDKTGNGTCAKFAYGSKSRCEVSKAAAGVGALLSILWCLSSAVSVYMVIRYKKTGIAPGTAPVNGRRPSTFPQADDDAKGAWSTKIDEHTPDDASDDERRRYGQTDDDDYKGLLQDAARPASRDTQTEHGAHPGRPLSFGSGSRSHSRASAVSTPEYDATLAPSALSPTDYGRQSAISPFPPPLSLPKPQSGGRMQFPSGNY